MKVWGGRKERSELTAAQSSNYGTQQSVGDGDFDDEEVIQPKGGGAGVTRGICRRT